MANYEKDEEEVQNLDIYKQDKIERKINIPRKSDVVSGKSRILYEREK